MNLSRIDTGISDIYGKKIYTGDIVQPVKFIQFIKYDTTKGI